MNEETTPCTVSTKTVVLQGVCSLGAGRDATPVQVQMSVADLPDAIREDVLTAIETHAREQVKDGR